MSVLMSEASQHAVLERAPLVVRVVVERHLDFASGECVVAPC
jgi:hypothetical protein